MWGQVDGEYLRSTDFEHDVAVVQSTYTSNGYLHKTFTSSQ